MTRIRRIYAVIAILMTAAISPLTAATADHTAIEGISAPMRVTDMQSSYVGTVYGSDDGLPQESIKSILQTQDGFVWIATQEGLARFDGQHFTNFNGANAPGLSNDNVHKIVEDASGVIWIHTGSDLCEYRMGRFSTVFQAQSGTGDRVHQLAVGLDGRAYFTTDSAIYRCTGTGPVLIAACGSSPDNYLVTRSGVVFWTTQGRVYRSDRKDACTGGNETSNTALPLAMWKGRIIVGGMRLYEVHGSQLVPFAEPVEVRAAADPLHPAYIGDGVQSMCADERDFLWIQSATALICLNPNWPIDKHYQSYQAVTSVSRSYHLFQDQFRHVWELDVNGGHNRLAKCLAGNMTGVSIHGIVPWEWFSYPVVMDPEGVVWIGSYKGLNCLRPVHAHTYLSGREMPETSIRSVFVARNRKVWVGTLNQGFGTLENNKFVPFPDPALRSRGISSLWEDAAGHLWVLVDTVHAFEYDGHIMRERKDVGYTKSSWQPSYICSSGELAWMDSAQLCQFDGKSTTRLDTGHPLLPGQNLFGFAKDARNIYTSVDKAFGWYSNGKWRWYGLAEGLPTVPIIDILPCGDGTAWLATWGEGICLFSKGQFHTIQTKDGLYADSIHRFLRDQHGRLWIGCSKGVFSVDEAKLKQFAQGGPAQFTCYPQDASDGVDVGSVAAVSSPAAFRDNDGSLWFAGEAGMTHIYPVPTSIFERPVVIEKATLNGKVVGTAGTVIVAPGDGTALFRFACLSFHSPTKIAYRYRLQGQDDTWSSLTSNATANYTNLAPGSYRFVAQAVNITNGSVIGTAGFDFTLHPHFYETVWFRLLLLALIVATPVLLISIRARAIQRRNAELEARVAERTVTIASQNVTLQALYNEVHEQNDQLQELQAELKEQNNELRSAQNLLERQNLQLEMLAATDGLTGLRNRRVLDERLAEEWRRSRRYSIGLSLIMIDVDHFKHFNDTYGHQAGDGVLATVAGVLRSHVKDTDFVARYGGEEFAIILPQTDSDSAYLVAERLRHAVEQHRWVTCPVTVSVGVATMSTADDSADAIVHRADDALYASKHAGRNRVTLSSPYENPSVLNAAELDASKRVETRARSVA